ncbi:MAG: tetraacyldisaccharide 4'-kinase [Sedimentisphaerales bacterium]|nr:tetraacyldisaccharide 4'-kinase [Sedimentisphaerales bacterium]
MNQEAYRNLVSGHTSGPRAIFLRLLLVLLSWPYSLVVHMRNSLYSRGLFRARRVSATVISVGNLTVGGTGKTPLVVWLCRVLRRQQRRCAVLTRGYKTRKGELSDEPAVLAANCPDVNVIVDPNRVAGARQAITARGADVLILDDGFQHRRLARDLDIVTIDATLPFGYGRLLPRGLLREPLIGLQRANAVVITRCDQVSEETLAQIEGQVRQIQPDVVIATAIHAPVDAVGAGTEIGLEELRGKRVYAFCGLGNPEAFFDTIRRVGCMLVASRRFDDHHAYTNDSLREIHRRARECNAEYIVTTQKDWTKIVRLIPPQGDPPMVYLAVEMEFVAGAERLAALIDRVLDGKMLRLQEPGK